MSYEIEDILRIMKDYNINRSNINNESDDYASVGVSVYGIEASLPSGNGTSDQVANEAIRMISEVPLFRMIRTDMKYIEDRLDRVTSGRHQEVMYHRLDGMTIRDIAKVTDYSKSHIHRLLVEVAKCINGTY